MVGWCTSRTATRVRVRPRVRVRSPSSQQCAKKENLTGAKEKSKLSHERNEFSFGGYLPESENGNRVMVVVDSSPEAKGALDWAMSHTIQNQDTIVLLHVAKKDEKNDEETNQKAYNLLHSTKIMCQQKRPEVHIELAFREGKEKGAIIVETAKRLKASLLVLGHGKQSFLRRFHMIWGSKKRAHNRVVDYCIQNANCMTIAVRRKNKKYGGYLITTKRHKNFWLLA